ncbi:Maltase 1 [Blattella germanica]|nr:Maltase 1 [Blattella germanica]
MSLVLGLLSLLAATSFTASAADSLEWWQTAVFYQVYPRSFMDSDGDGVGDLNGITSKLDHLADAGVGAVWLSPIYKSPMADFGYDIANFTDVDPIFGNLEDFDNLQARAKELDVFNESEWFKKSVQKIDPYTDYYVWIDPKYDENGTRIPPSNWLSVFGGSAWEWREERQQYYLHQFVNVIRFWLDKGVDGFRIDAVPYLFEDPDLKDEPLSGDPNALPTEANYLTHVYTQNLPGTFDMIEQWREVVDEKSNETGETKVLMLETYAPLDDVMHYYGTPERPGGHFPFNFLMIQGLNNESNAYDFNSTVHEWMDNMINGRWPNWVIGNHDQKRVATRYGSELLDGLSMISLLLPGSGITYNGDEIGMVDAYISYEDTVDPAGINAGPDRYQLFSRDPCRTPLQWDNSTSAGFSTSDKTWLPVNPNYLTLNLAAEKEAPKSHYKVYQKIVAARKFPTIQTGSLTTYPASEKVFAFSRVLEGSAPFVIVVNLGADAEQVDLSGLEDVPEDLVVYVASIDSNKEEGITFDNTDLKQDENKSNHTLITFRDMLKIQCEYHHERIENSKQQNIETISKISPLHRYEYR